MSRSSTQTSKSMINNEQQLQPKTRTFSTSSNEDSETPTNSSISSDCLPLQYMFEVLREFYDKKSPLFIITIAVLIAAVIAMGFDVDSSFKRAGELHLFEASLVVLGVVEVVFKTCGMEIFRRFCSSEIAGIHMAVIASFILLNALFYAWGVTLYLQFRRTGVSAINEPHEFLVQVYTLVMGAAYLVIVGLLVSLKLENQTMTVLEQQKDDRNELSF